VHQGSSRNVPARPSTVHSKHPSPSADVAVTAKAATEFKRRKSALKGHRVSAEMKQLRKKRSVTFQDALTQVRTFGRDDEPQHVGVSE
jgi:hypothetical protein